MGEPSKSAEAYALILAAEAYAGKPVDTEWQGSWWMKRGKEMEREALAFYAFMQGCDIAPAGFVTDDADTYGCSPDALVGDDGLAEIKCLKAETHIMTILYYRGHKTCPPAYIQQSQGQMMTTGRKWCDLVFYHQDLPLLVIRQKPNKAVVDGLRDALPKVIARRDEVLAILHEAGNHRKAAA